MVDLMLMIIYLIAFNAALLAGYALVRLFYAVTGREWPEGN